MDEVAAAAQVSKQTVYKQFADKEQLFRAIVDGVAHRSADVIAAIEKAFGSAPATSLPELHTRLRKVARVYLDGVLDPHVLSLRRLIIAEADRFPDLARSYYERGPAQGVDVIATCLATYVGDGLLIAEDLRLAAAHFAYLTLGIAQDRAMFQPSAVPSARERNRLAAAAAATFIAAHRTG